jgi:hypothetical protein
MNDYFDQFEQSVGRALEHGAHLPWYSRGWRIRHGRVFAAVFGALVIGTPAGAVTNCFGACTPGHPQVTVTADQRPQPSQTREQLSSGRIGPWVQRRQFSAPRHAAELGATGSSSTPLRWPHLSRK